MSEANYYTDAFKAWPANLRGPKPSSELLATAHGLGLRPGKQALAVAMALRDCGVTGNQIVMACGAPQLNRMRGLVADSLCRKLTVPPSSEHHTVYKLEVTAKGKQRIERAVKAAEKLAAEGAAKADKPVKAAGKAKGAVKKPRAKAAPVADTSTGEPAAATNEPVTADQPETANA